LAEIGASLFIQLNDMLKINHMYRFSLAHFTKIFEKSLIIGYTIEDIKKKLEFAQSQLYSNLLDDLGISLFKNDRLLFALHLTRGVNPESIPESEWALFLGNLITPNKAPSMPKWLPEERRIAYESLVHCLP
jgi:dynein heavy chain 2